LHSFSVDKITDKLKQIILELGKTDWDFDFEGKMANTSFVPEMNTDDGLTPAEWLIDVYKKMFDKNFTEKDIEIEAGVKL
jgi:hypothetical protein